MIKTTYKIEAAWPCSSYNKTFEEAMERFKSMDIPRRIVKMTEEVIQFEPGGLKLSTCSANFESQKDPWVIE